jgi:hypothetical protein
VSRSDHITLALAAVILACLAGFAVAQEPPPVATPDTEFTPGFRDGAADSRWRQRAGGIWRPDASAQTPPALVEDSDTPLSMDFYGVDFLDERNGLAVGAACPEDTPYDQLESLCERRPAVYRYSAPPGEPAQWTRMELPGSEEPGYVADVEWLGPDRALAVGGTGEYPYREDPAPVTAATDPAGTGRVWLMEAGAWRELTPEPGMSALTALGVGPRPDDCGPQASECGIAGGLAQLWTWDGSGLTRVQEIEDATSFRFRVRDVDFAPGAERQGALAYAVTSGCCGTVAAETQPTLLVLNDESTPEARASRWYARTPWYGGARDSDGKARSAIDSVYSMIVSQVDTGQARRSLGYLTAPGGEPGPGVKEPASRVIGPVFADSPSTSRSAAALSPANPLIVLGTASSAGAEADDTGTLTGELTNPVLADIRLVSGDGDVGRTPSQGVKREVPLPAGRTDGLMDWAVGEHLPTAQAVAMTTLEMGETVPNPMDCPGGSGQISSSVANLECRPSDAPADKMQSRRLFLLPSYRLNAYTAVGTAGDGWAVGDKGAILQLGGDDAATGGGDEPAPPKLGRAEVEDAPDTSAWDPFRPLSLTAEPGVVPPLVTRPLDPLPEPRIVPEGTPNPTVQFGLDESIGAIAMSRDGREGWGVGPGESAADRPVLHRFDGERWIACDPKGVGTQLPADRACAGVASLIDRGLNLHDIARVPVEDDDDSENDDAFEAIAVGHLSGPAFLKYSGGEWTALEVPSAGTGAQLLEIEIVAPGEAWIAGRTTTAPVLYRFDGAAVTDCFAQPAACGLDPNVLPQFGTEPRMYLASAGDRLYLAGNRRTEGATSGSETAPLVPVILQRDAGEEAWSSAGGGCDPCPGDAETDTGRITGISVARDGDGYVGWAIGRFGPSADQVSEQVPRDVWQRGTTTVSAPALRLEDGTWRRWSSDDALADYYGGGNRDVVEVATLPERGGEALLMQQNVVGGGSGPAPLLHFDPAEERWNVVPTPFDAASRRVDEGHARLEGLAPAPGGEAVISARGGGDVSNGRRGRDGAPTAFFRFARRRHRPVFDDVAHPIREGIADVAAASDGRLWVATYGDRVYRYDRVTGWDSLRVPGWQASSNATRAARANAIAVGADGRGLVVGDGGRIASTSPLRVVLDAASGKSCRDAPPPCGTGQDLHAAAVAPDGSAIVAGENRTILWRPAGGAFQRADVPRGVPFNATFTGVSMPTGERAYLAADTGHVVVGSLSAGAWSWQVENLDAEGKLLALDERLDVNRTLGLQDIDVDAAGNGYAVGDEGLILQRSGSTGRWERVAARYRDDFTSVTLSQGTALRGALIGGEMGVVLTLVDGRLRVARHADAHDPLVASAGPSSTGTIAGLALVPGTEPGELEAWAALQVRGGNRTPAPQAMLHYSSDPSDEMLDGVASLRPLPDAPLPRPGEITFAAFGRSDCHLAAGQASCDEMHGTNRFHEVVSRRIVDELVRRSKRPGGPILALFTGDVDAAAGRNDDIATPLDRDVAHRRWLDLVAKRLGRGGLPLYAAVGRGDLSQVKGCVVGVGCAGSQQAEQARTNAPWRETMAGMPRPWGDGEPAAQGDLEFVPVGEGGSAAEAPGGGANTHYAFDVERGGETLMRVAVVDTSHGSLAASEREQQPVEPGGQSRWLDRVLCRRGSAGSSAQECTLEPGTPSVVLGNTPTYSYGPGGLTETMADYATFEATLLQHKVTTMVAGRLGWNGRYFATAPGLHFPCPNGTYPESPPRPGEAATCGQTDGLEQARAAAGEAAQQAADALQSLNPPEAPVPAPAPPNAEEELAKVTGTVTGLVDFVVASGGGGRLANERGSASDGYWHGYTLVRLMPGNDPQRTIVEQRPVFDWVSVSADRRMLRPGGSTTVRGVGREPVGSDHHVRYDAINSPAITHRYDLVRADPEKPWRPLLDADGNYVPLPASVGRIAQDGRVTAGAGNQERTYALAILSVGDKAAALPLVFEPRRSFQAPDPPVSASGTNVTISNPPQQPPIVVLGTAAASAPPPTSPPPGATPSNLSPTFPPPLSFSTPPPINATPTAAPPPPPPAPPPPASEGAAPLNLSLKVSGLNIAPQMSTFPPPAPPVNPAPPGGARKEARQRQAAVAKSEQGGDGKGEGADAHGRSDAVDSPNSAMTRLDQGKGNRMAFAAHERRDQPSAWARAALYGGGLTLAALLMAMTWTTARPRDRRRTPEVPAPAYARRRRS